MMKKKNPKQDVVKSTQEAAKSVRETALGWVVRETAEELPLKLKPKCLKGACMRERERLGQDRGSVLTFLCYKLDLHVIL